VRLEATAEVKMVLPVLPVPTVPPVLLVFPVHLGPREAPELEKMEVWVCPEEQEV